MSAVVLMRQRAVAGDVLAYTTCPFRGPAVVVVSAGVAPEDSMPVRVHEEVHAEQCRVLGPVRYRLRNLTGRGKLALEAPAYCAATKARLRSGWPAKRARERLDDDVRAVLFPLVDSIEVAAIIRRDCASV